ncbi:MAG: hypothetical protein EOL87_11260 [Spartobacteria bacterium]|nr:hypothetical protein [Spartobacteria bacterium]
MMIETNRLLWSAKAFDACGIRNAVEKGWFIPTSSVAATFECTREATPLCYVPTTSVPTRRRHNTSGAASRVRSLSPCYKAVPPPIVVVPALQRDRTPKGLHSKEFRNRNNEEVKT